jgi:hypothetical protein
LGDAGRLTYLSGLLTEIVSLKPLVGGSDTIIDTGGDNIAFGGQGPDDITVDSGNDVVLGDNGRIIFGPAGSIALIEPVEDELTGGDDIILKEGGTGTIIGGPGDDAITILSDGGITVRGGAEYVSIGDAESTIVTKAVGKNLPVNETIDVMSMAVDKEDAAVATDPKTTDAFVSASAETETAVIDADDADAVPSVRVVKTLQYSTLMIGEADIEIAEQTDKKVAAETAHVGAFTPIRGNSLDTGAGSESAGVRYSGNDNIRNLAGLVRNVFSQVHRSEGSIFLRFNSRSGSFAESMGFDSRTGEKNDAYRICSSLFDGLGKNMKNYEILPSDWIYKSN